MISQTFQSLPQIESFNDEEKFFIIQADVDDIKVFLQTLIDGIKPKVTVLVQNVGVSHKLPSELSQSIQALISNIVGVVNDTNSTIKADSVNAKLTISSIFLLDKILHGLIGYNREISAITAAQRGEEFDRILSMNPNFQKYVDNLND